MKDWLPLIGVVIAQVVILMLFWAKQRADDKRRWHEKRLAAYTAYVAAERTLVKAAATTLGEMRTSKPVNHDRVSIAYEVLADRYFDVELLSSDDVRDKALNLRDAASWFDAVANMNDTAGWMKNFTKFAEARRSFSESVRVELGITKPQRKFFIEADSRSELAWRALEVVLTFGYGRLGRRAVQRLRAKREATPPRTAGSYNKDGSES